MLDRFLAFVGRHRISFIWALAVLWVTVFTLWALFVYEHSRLPFGRGELWNWVFGL